MADQRPKRAATGLPPTTPGAENALVRRIVIATAAVLIIYAVIGTLCKSFLQPIIVMSVVPFCFIGAVYGIFIQGTTLNLLGMMGVVALVGIVVNDSLVMVEFINRRRREGMEMEAAIVEAGRVRLRPIILTSLTTIFGLLPLAYFATGQAALLSPLAQSIVWGLTFSTVLTLIAVPCVYANVERLRALTIGAARGAIAAFRRRDR